PRRVAIPSNGAGAPGRDGPPARRPEGSALEPPVPGPEEHARAHRPTIRPSAAGRIRSHRIATAPHARSLYPRATVAIAVADRASVPARRAPPRRSASVHPPPAEDRRPRAPAPVPTTPTTAGQARELHRHRASTSGWPIAAASSCRHRLARRV